MQKNNSTDFPRAEHPDPFMRRPEWMNLNGIWEFETDPEANQSAENILNLNTFSRQICVPFCMESELSGVHIMDFCNCVWYRRTVELSKNDRRVLLHIGACDYETTVYVNRKKVGQHFGGYISFSFDISDYLRDGENEIVIRAADDVQAHCQPSGKQSARQDSYGCYYTRTTGIWQTVWLEFVPRSYIRALHYESDIEKGILTVRAETVDANGMLLFAEALWGEKPAGKSVAHVCGNSAVLQIPLSEVNLWEVGKGGLYDLNLTLGTDQVKSYFGMRSVAAVNGVLQINGKPVFQRLVLDQGFYPDGIYTAPSAEKLLADIRRSMEMGFNGARLHQKIFEPLFLYYCDRAGYMVWEEHGNWGLDLSKPEAWGAFLPEWSEIVERDCNHPAIIGWCPLNEVQRDRDEKLVRYLMQITKAMDPTRPVIATSGWNHVKNVGDFVDWHDYDQNPVTLKERYENVAKGIPVESECLLDPILPTFISEFGGIRWDVKKAEENSWGYGAAPKTEAEFKERFRGLCEAMMNNPAISGFCYTQLTDIEQEVNGLYSYDRIAKFVPSFFKEVLSKPAAVEIQQTNCKKN